MSFSELTCDSHVKLNSSTTTSMRLVAFWNSFILANTSLKSFLDNASSNPIPRFPPSMIAAISSSSTRASTLSLRSLASPPSKPSPAPKSTVSIPPQRARSRTLAMFTSIPARTTPRSGPLLQASGPQGLTLSAPRPRKSSRACAWSTLNSDTMFLVCYCIFCDSSSSVLTRL